MPITYGSQINTQRIPILGLRPEQGATASAPASPVEGLFWNDTDLHVIKVYLNGAWVTLGSAGAGGPPSGAATGDLGGSYPSPTVLKAQSGFTIAGTLAVVTTDSRLSDSRTPGGTAGGDLGGTYPTPTVLKAQSGFTIAGAAAVVTTDPRLTDSRAPGGTAGGDLSGTYPNPNIGTGKVTSTHLQDGTVLLGDLNSSLTDGTAGSQQVRSLGTSATQALAGNTRLDQIIQPANPVFMNNQLLRSLQAPLSYRDAATKGYVDNLVQGADVHPSVRVASIPGGGNLGTYTPGTGGVALSNNASMTAMPNVVDGVTLIAGSRVLLKDQTNQQSNGIWQVTTVGTGANGVWARPADFTYAYDSTEGSGTYTASAGTYVFVESGTNADTGWIMTTDPPINIDGTSATNLVWSQFTATGTIIDGAGLKKTGNTFDVGGTAGRIAVSPDNVDIDTNYVGQASITTLGTVTTGVWSATLIPVAKGGTGAGTAPAARANLTSTSSPLPQKVLVTLPALSAGVGADVAHNLGYTGFTVDFTDGSTSGLVMLDWKNKDVNTITVTADIAYPASRISAAIIG